MKEYTIQLKTRHSQRRVRILEEFKKNPEVDNVTTEIFRLMEEFNERERKRNANNGPKN